MISATMPISDMKKPNSCIPELAIAFALIGKVSLPGFCQSSLLGRSIICAGADGKKMSQAEVPLSGTGMWDVGDAGPRWVHNYHNRSCMQMWGEGWVGGWQDGAPPPFSRATGRQPLSTFFFFFFPPKENKAAVWNRFRWERTCWLWTELCRTRTQHQ